MEAATQPGGWWSRNWPWAVGTLCALGLPLFLLVFGGLFWTVQRMITDSEPHRMALHGATHHPEVVALIGTPVQRGWLVTGSIHHSGGSGGAVLSIPLIGPDGRATLHVAAERRLGTWRITEAELAHGKAGRIALAPDDFTLPAAPRPLR